VTLSGPVKQVVGFLENAGYDSVEQPKPVGGIPFEFVAMLAGRSSLDLIVLVDLAVDTDDRAIRRRVEALARALDLVRSRRSLTVILVGPLRGAGLIQSIASVARVLTVGTPVVGDDQSLRDALAVLLPLEVVTEDDEASEAWALRREAIRAAHPNETEAVLLASRSGTRTVREALRDLLREPVEQLDIREAGNNE
jgi:hypothetical protein